MIGESLPRLEDAALLTGRGRFIDDMDLPGQAWVRFLRSPHAHADILGVDDGEALTVPGAVALLRDSLETGPLDNRSPVRRRDGAPLVPPPFPAFARDRVRYAGEIVAMAVAETAAAARDMAEAVAVDYRPLDPADTEELFEWATGDAAEVEARFARAAHRIRIPLANNRISAAPLETRGALAEWDARDRRYTLFAPTQGPGQVQEALAKALGAARADVRVITPDVGGGFGMKNGIFSEQVLLAHAARLLGRPLKWIDDRAEAFLSDYHARDHDTVAELALDAEGIFLAIRTSTRSDLGAYATGAGPVIPTDGGSRMLANVYRIPAVHAETVCRLSHTTPITAYRGAGKPEYGYIVERLVDEAARKLAIDPAELRRRNMIRPEEMPWRTPTGLVYDSGDFAGNLDAALELADRAGFAERRRASEAAGKLRGFGFASYTEPDGYKDGRVTMRFDEEGLLTVTLTASSNGQGFATTFSQIAAAQLGLPVEAIRVLTGDSDIVGRGSGAGGSRVTTVAGAATVRASERIVEKGRRIAAAMLEA
ncbi:MAG: xanthine dehydrogenase family protein, partial [Alphaproteobacteria bacterium]|nr:xanthine dehydrogenase family protein [Alphaproteobacteria bacterium]